MKNPSNDKVKYQEAVFDKKAGKRKIYAIGGRKNRNHAIKLNKIFETLQFHDGDKVLEIGTGEGEHAYWCLKYSGIFYTGVDISRRSLDVADKRLCGFKNRYLLKKENANRLSFDNDHFDSVFCAATLHHMEEPFSMISEMVRVLKPNGKIALMEPNWIYPSNVGFAIFLREDRNMFLMKKRNLYRWLKKAGLKDIKVENLLYTPPAPKKLIPFYDHVDEICGKLPMIRAFSLMLFGSAVK